MSEGWKWGLITVGGLLAVGIIKMQVFYVRHGRKAERACAGKKTVRAYNRCIEKRLRGRRV